MLLFSIPQFSSNQNEDPILKMRQYSRMQQEDLTTLCKIVEYLKGNLQVGLDHQDVKKYVREILMINNHQTKRYEGIDALINENIFQMKKGKTKDNSVLLYGKEVRKLESGLRTLRLFVCDAIEMLSDGKVGENRSEDRILYFETRSPSLESEISILSNQLSKL
ncbi:chemotaxis protein [Solibacillus sp. R5-41]|uniref:chemotaxis protein n=1 Tax=Solibacillus sp. R5-41 TaxID=2048654 RepID=UPI000C126D37|nr:chemotaxis protein [Solibacillus sp. R5-41]ATP42013.1 chemotaxis protein [Solibacillus sp. R5-41]